MDLNEFIRDVPDFPKPGIVFKDITPLLGSPVAFNACLDQFTARYADKQIDQVVGIESRGFLFGAPLALRLGAGFVPVRKPNKLPYETVSHSYDLEYGSDTVEMHVDALTKGQRVVVIDDLLATGGTAQACLQLVKGFDVEVVEVAFCIHLSFLEGEKKLGGQAIYSLLTY